MDNSIAKLYQSNKAILTTKDLALIWEENDKLKRISDIKVAAEVLRSLGSHGLAITFVSLADAIEDGKSSA